MLDAVVATVPALHAPALLAALQAAEIEAVAVEIDSFAQLDYFLAQRTALAEIRVAAADAGPARALLALLEEDADRAAAIEAESSAPASASPQAAHKPSRRAIWIAGASVALAALGLPLLARARRPIERTASHLLHGVIHAAPSAIDQVGPELHRAGVR